MKEFVARLADADHRETIELQEKISQYLAEWVRSAAQVDKYVKEDKEIYVATNGNKQLVLTCHRVMYEYISKKIAHVNMVWMDNGTATVIHQDILGEKFGQTTHSTGLIWGEDVESVWLQLYNRTKENEVSNLGTVDDGIHGSSGGDTA
jgi:hypothetical protein